MPDPLTPAARQDVREALAFKRGKASRSYQNPAAIAAAEHLVEALERNGFVVMRRAPAPAHAGQVPAHGYGWTGPRRRPASHGRLTRMCNLYSVTMGLQAIRGAADHHRQPLI